MKGINKSISREYINKKIKKIKYRHEREKKIHIAVDSGIKFSQHYGTSATATFAAAALGASETRLKATKLSCQVWECGFERDKKMILILNIKIKIYKLCIPVQRRYSSNLHGKTGVVKAILFSINIKQCR